MSAVLTPTKMVLSRRVARRYLSRCLCARRMFVVEWTLPQLSAFNKSVPKGTWTNQEKQETTCGGRGSLCVIFLK
jgi:hypothetical protein